MSKPGVRGVEQFLSLLLTGNHTGVQNVLLKWMKKGAEMTEQLSKTSGQIVTIDHDKRMVTIKDKDGIVTPLVWKEGLDSKMQKLKEHFFTSIIHIGEMIEDTAYFPKPADWPVQQSVNKGSSGRPFTPRNEKIIVLQSSLKAAVDLFQCCHVPDTQDYDSACTLVIEKAIEMTRALMKEGGA